MRVTLVVVVVVLGGVRRPAREKEITDRGALRYHIFLCWVSDIPANYRIIIPRGIDDHPIISNNG